MYPSPATTISPPPLPPILPRLKRGGQPGNQNARKDGTFSQIHPGALAPSRDQVKLLGSASSQAAISPQQLIAQARALRQSLFLPGQASLASQFQALRMHLRLGKLIERLLMPSVLEQARRQTLEDLARNPLALFLEVYRGSGITRDADSFFTVFEKSAQYSPLPPDHPHLPANLTDSQWDAIAPLIPPDPHLDWLTGEPPVIIAANRWHFTEYVFTGWSQDETILQEHHRIRQRFPGLMIPSSPPACKENLTSRRKPGRPRTSSRALLDAILWKFATGHSWQDLPQDFPPMRICRNYYRRLFKSGRWYTLILALYNHFCMESSSDLMSMVENDIFTTTPGQKIALSPRASLSWEHCTALFFMQLACSAHRHSLRLKKQRDPLFPLPPILKGTSPLTSCLPPGRSSSKRALEDALEDSSPPSFPFQSLEESIFWKKWQQILNGRLESFVAEQDSGGISPGNAYN